MALQTDLPGWIHVDESRPGFVVVDPDEFYPIMLASLDVSNDDADAYWLEVAHQCMKLDVQLHLRLSGKDPRPEKSLVISVTGKPGHKARWGQDGREKGRMEDLEMQYGDDAWKHVAREAREHYRRTRGVLPS